MTGDFSCTASSGQTITCTLANLDAGATATLTVAYDVDTATEADPAVDNTASATADDGGSDDDTTSVAIVEDVVLDVTKTFDDATVTAGGAASGFTITVKNTGVSQADNVNLTDTVDGRLIVGTVTGDFSCTDPDTDAQTITCTLANLDAGATATLTVAYDVDTATEADPVVDNTRFGHGRRRRQRRRHDQRLDRRGRHARRDQDLCPDQRRCRDRQSHVHHRRPEHGRKPGRQHQPDRCGRRPPAR